MCSIIGYCGQPLDREAFWRGFARTNSRGPDDSRLNSAGPGAGELWRQRRMKGIERSPDAG